MSEETVPIEETQPEEQQTAPDSTPESETIAALLKQIEDLTKERDDMKDQLLRGMADHQNFRRRIMQEREKDRVLATQDLIRDLLPVLDNFERTLAALAAGASVESITEGVLNVDRQLRNVLEGRQLVRIKAMGQPFDPNKHEAIAVEESEDHPDNTVLQELEAGYTMSDTVIRPARVKVTKRP
ncbi:MAG: nucleotide exchange factor GrpE [Fimbriimonadaceae bacterium]|nr:nucleotide exchange factor GrpE [Fimbriimonadaceae bacterium]